MSDDPRATYIEARDHYSEIRERTAQHARLVKGVGTQIADHPIGFVTATLLKKPSGGLHTGWDLTNWPSAETLSADFLALNAAWENCRAMWEAVPHGQRSSCSPPPAQLGGA